MSTSIYTRKRQVSYNLKCKFGSDNKIAGIQEKCLFVFAGANQMKKNIGAIVDGFNLADNGHMSLILALKNTPCQIGTYQFVGEYDVKDMITNPNIKVVTAALSDRVHADLYRMSDFLLYPSQGEAPGLQVSEAQFCGCIPIVTNYTGLPEESCFQEFLIEDFTFNRGQFNCYRAIVSAQSLATKISQAFDFWSQLNGEGVSSEQASTRYDKFMNDVQKKFADRTWQNTAKELDSVFQSFKQNSLRIDSELVKL